MPSNNDEENDLSHKLSNYNQSISPHSRRNTKNLSLKLNNDKSGKEEESDGGIRSFSQTASPTQHKSFSINLQGSSKSSLPASPTGFRLYRHPSLSHHPESNNTTSAPLRRRTTLSLSIPSEIEASSKSSSKLSSNSIPSFSTSSPITSSPIIPSTPKDFLHYSSFNSQLNSEHISSRSSLSSSSTLKQGTHQNGDLKTQTLIQNLSNMDITNDGENSKMNAYPNGPICVLEPNLYLYSEPTLEQIKSFDLVLNVARELKIPFQTDKPLNESGFTILHYEHILYYYVPWTHTSKLCADLSELTDVIIDNLNQNRKVLIHCQCGVSRSASLIVALFMKLNHANLNDSYNLLKEKAQDISPNMSLIFQLMEWGEMIGVHQIASTPQFELNESPIGTIDNFKNLISPAINFNNVPESVTSAQSNNNNDNSNNKSNSKRNTNANNNNDKTNNNNNNNINDNLNDNTNDNDPKDTSKSHNDELIV